MTSFLLRRFAGLFVSLIVVTIAVFAAVHLAPGDPLDSAFEGATASDEAVEAMRADYGLDKPLPVQYLSWLGGVLHGDFGQSIAFGQDVRELLVARAGTSLALVLYGMILVVGLGVLLGAISARNPGLVDRMLLVVTGTATAIPAYVAAVILISVFAIQLGWFPTFGAGEGFLGKLHHLTLPAIALAISHMGLLARVSRMSIIDEMERPHVAVARSRGVEERVILRRHVLRNAIAPIMTISATRLGSLIAGTTIVETAFGIPGLGSMLVRAVSTQDFPVVQAVTLLIVVVFVVTLLLVDVVHSRIDPRVSFGGTRR